MPQLKLKRNQLLLIAALFLGLVFFVGFKFGKSQVTRGGVFGRKLINRDQGQPANIDFSLFWTVWRRAIDLFPAELNLQAAVYGAIDGAIESLNDPYSDFFTPEEAKEFEGEIEGSFEGVGIEIGEKEGRVVVIAPLEGTPAQRAGILAGDTIRKVDGKEIEGSSLSSVIKLIRGPAGTEVRLTIGRNAQPKPLEFSLRRGKITVDILTVSERRTRANKRISQLKLSQFTEETDEELNEAASAIIKSQPDALILDLRNNPGGFFDAAVTVASYFTAGDPLAQELDRLGKVKRYSPTVEPKLEAFPLIVLVNRGSASASEIVAGAIQDYAAGTVIGEVTFGKGTVQSFEKFGDGSALKITIGRWQTGKGREINETGIKPDIEVKDDPNTAADEILEAALNEFDRLPRNN